MSDTQYPLTLFRFQVDFERVSLGSPQGNGNLPICRGAFSECTGIEATMEPKVIKAGGLNYGAQQRAGPVSFGTVILKRGMTTTRDLWRWFSHVNEQGRYAFRLNVAIRAAGPGEEQPGAALVVRLHQALPVKFKCADLSARATEVGIEELHLAHEGLSLE
ncbi:MAG: phage tail protein [Chthoniobacteraceae bacterium]